MSGANDSPLRSWHEPIPAPIQEHMTGRSWHSDPRCPRFSALRLLHIPCWGFDHQAYMGEMVVAHAVADEALEAFDAIFTAQFPLGAMRLIAHFGGDDHASMAANNCSAFNFREISTRPELSQHAFGLAIDINPVCNPYVRANGFVPANGEPYLDRHNVRPGMIVPGGPVTNAFEAIGWGWGGDWQTVKDYHHFSKTGR